ncbi:hypothetical protein V6N13_025407 [Hibiscus sabdariffa]|uniref:PTC1-like winged helix-turn-helix domain-containing protein n=1 Tax=Hibiscus sabdariffa TaxID=183260 RepID=A0ABR2P8S3_9ROSI
MDSRWPAKRLELVAQVIVDALKQHKSQFGLGGMTRQDLRDVTRIHIDDTESELLMIATRAVLDSKHFVKDWQFRDEDEKLLRLLCQVKLDLLDLSLFHYITQSLT